MGDRFKTESVIGMGQNMQEEKTQIIKDITNVFAQMKSDKFAEGTWVVINEVDDGNWGEGGSVLYADDA